MHLLCTNYNSKLNREIIYDDNPVLNFIVVVEFNC